MITRNHLGEVLPTPELTGFRRHTRAVTRERPSHAAPLACAATKAEVRRVQEQLEIEYLARITSQNIVP